MPGTRSREVPADRDERPGTPVWEEQFSPDRDFVGSPPPTVRYLLCTAPRSGSHFLAGLLHETGLFGCPLEYFNPNNRPRWKARAAEAGWTELVPFLESIRTSPNGCFGMIVHYMQLAALERHVPLAQLATDYRFVVLQREDLLTQAISLVLAGQDGEFISETGDDDEDMPPDRSRGNYQYKRRVIQHHMRLIASNYTRWQLVLDSLGVPYLRLRYKDVVRDRGEVIARIAEHVGVRLPNDFTPPPARTRKQHHPLKEEWKRRFLEESSDPEVTLDALDRAKGSGLL